MAVEKTGDEQSLEEKMAQDDSADCTLDSDAWEDGPN